MTTHTDTPTEAFTLLAGDAYLTPAQYAAAHGVTIRTVRRYLAADKLEGAKQLEGGEWMIPAEATPLEAASTAIASSSSSTDVERAGAHAGRRLVQHVTLEQQLQQEPAYLDLETAARLLGVKPADIRRNREAFEVPVWCGPRSILVPQALVRSVAGIA
jgi:hypothetical protein